jgi:RimJ/RimL family protein N-acetyltransferase
MPQAPGSDNSLVWEEGGAERAWMPALEATLRESGAAGARQQLRQLLASHHGRLQQAQLLGWIQYGQRYAGPWWEPQIARHAALAKAGAGDAAFFRESFEKKAFAGLYNRQTPWRGDLEKALGNAYLSHFEDAGSIHWTVLDRHQRRVGLASLSSYSKDNARAEVSLGFPVEVPASTAMAASLLVLRFAFSVAKLNKLTSFVYEDNGHARDFTRNFGFAHEGFLADHFFLPPFGFVGVNVFGLTRKSLHQNARLRGLSVRMGIGEPIDRRVDPMLWINA